MNILNGTELKKQLKQMRAAETGSPLTGNNKKVNFTNRSKPGGIVSSALTLAAIKILAANIGAF